MRIAYLTQSYFPMTGVTALFATRLSEAMLTFGHQVLVLTASDKDHLYHTYKENLTIVRLSSIKDPCRAGERLFFRPQRMVTKTLTQFRPDLIHVLATIQTGIPALVYAKRAHIPILITLRDSQSVAASRLFQPILERLYGWYARRTLLQYSAVLVSTQSAEIRIPRTAGCKIIPITGAWEFSTGVELTENVSAIKIFKNYERTYLDIWGKWENRE